MSHFANQVLKGLPPKNPGEAMIIIRMIKWCGWQVAFAFMLVIIAIGCIVAFCMKTFLGDEIKFEILPNFTAEEGAGHA